MEDDIICLLQDLGKDVAIEVISKFISRNPDTEHPIASRVNALLYAPEQATESAISDAPQVGNLGSSSFISNLASIASSLFSDTSYKMVFVVNLSLNMGRGKQCAQVAHAAVGLCIKLKEGSNLEQKNKILEWIATGQKKIVLKGENLQQMLSIQEEAEKVNLPTILISDAGCTQIAPGSKTVLAIFGSCANVDQVTGALKLL